MNTRRPPARIAGSTSGKVMRSAVRTMPAPAERAASSRVGSMERSAPLTRRNTSGVSYTASTKMMPQIE